MNDQNNLIENMDNQIIKIRTKSLDVSFNEIYDMYKDGELIITPDYQRLFRWDPEKQSRFIETLLLEMPIPPIFVIEKDENVYELIDGLQRISSYLHFRGEKIDSYTANTDFDEEEGILTPPIVDSLTLIGCDIVPALNGKKFDDLPKSLQIKLKRSFVRMEIIRKDSEASLKYHMFKRLNTGGELLSSQEIRNCTIRLIDKAPIDFIERCSMDENFKKLIDRVDKNKKSQKFIEEQVLRFFALKNDLEKYRYPFEAYLTEYMEFMAHPQNKFDFHKEQDVFARTFKIIYDICGEDAFSSKGKVNIKQNFVQYYFDGISIAFSTMLDNFNGNDNYTCYKKTIDKIKFGDQIKLHSTGSKSGIKARIKLFEDALRNAGQNG